MSWWDTGDGDDVVGDRPADILTTALADLADWRREANSQRPSLGGLLAGLSAALSAPGRTVAITADTEAGLVQGVDDVSRAEGAELLTRLRAAVEKVAASYQERWERDPRPSEVAYVAAFVLGPSPGRYLRDADGLELNALRAEVEES